MRGPLQCVLWDVKDTLLKVRMSVGQQYCMEARRAGLDLKTSEVDVAFRQAYQHCSRRYPNYGITQGMDGQSWWMKVVRDTFSRCKVQDPTLLNTMALNLYNDFCNPENWEVFPDCQKALESCSSLGLTLGVVSNFDRRLEGILQACGLLTHFSFLVTSEEAGVAKPDPAIFEQALQRCGVAASNTAHIGDHYLMDYLSSRSLGIHGYLLDRQNKYTNSDIPSEHRIGSLDELPMRLQHFMD
ncbi:haloacid dehalogenase-like hydrolase domain-containing protein 3 [Gadus morhua]|uniref:Haloacid dehalogenase-like hydrolase domain-containing protein 3 n=1 Tax=Gadus morhua TaxID=8049 RepID=A0A8C5CAZ2_GADMO|nr:haloacid dehalogenase-like hydrolase domain-containing protein 3 [Gadus morhua]XP_030216868.1 haloacid dehalogenase-like hydrolase domain-containing protein 3 [Gadus morhua]XP_056465910.1 haloacid dehalogenase-like hydrolase domain-containing protein 3 [Gadus chalcogrammus]XP_059919144.1 haloacid dehalogenase-like hydrolase domain-containing protein 3 [Gadus macrocephalus]XP_059919149.1 haloacid dehalogenase-like hydrolase domain-containing protein 3 [Gadus macrocephalus]